MEPKPVFENKIATLAKSRLMEFACEISANEQNEGTIQWEVSALSPWK